MNTLPLTPSSLPAASQSQLATAQAPSFQSSPMANSTAPINSVAPSVSAKTTPTSEVPPQSPPQQASKLSPKDDKRVAALLHLNNVIIKELSVLQASGPDKPQSPSSASNPTGPPPLQSPSSTTTPTGGGVSTTPTEPNAPSVPSAGTPTSATTPGIRALPTKKQITENYSRRLQVNIAYLLGMSQNKPVPSFPQAMEPPPETWIAVAEGTKEEQKARWEDMKEGYGRLKECWPDYRLGMRPQIPPAATNQGNNQGGAMASMQGNQAGPHHSAQAHGQQQQQQQPQQQQLTTNNPGNMQPHPQFAPQTQQLSQMQLQQTQPLNQAPTM